MRRRSKVLVALAFMLSCLVGCVPLTSVKPAKAKPVSVAKAKPKPSTPTALPAASAPGDWTTYAANSAGTSDNPDETSITAANVASLQEVWHAPSGANPWAGTFPLVAGGSVFDTEIYSPTDSTFATTLSAYDLESGAVRWQRNLDSEQQVIGVAYGLVLVANQNWAYGSKVQAFDQKTGAARWFWTAPDEGGQISGNVLTASGHLLVPIAGALWALDPATGRELYFITCTADEGVNCPFNVGSGTAAAGSLIYAGGWHLSAGFQFSAVDGHRIDALGVPYTPVHYLAPLISGNQVFVRSAYMGSDHQWIGKVAAFSTASCAPNFCTPQWDVDVPGGAGSLAVADGRLFVLGPEGGTLEALNSANGQVLWQGDAAPDLNGAVSVAGDVLYVAQGQKISAYPVAGCASGEHCPPLWTLKIAALSNDLWAPTVVTGGRLLYVDELGLHALAVS